MRVRPEVGDGPAPEGGAERGETSTRAREGGEQGDRPPGAFDEAEWPALAYSLYLRGERNWTALGQRFGKDRQTVKGRVFGLARQLGALRAERGEDVPALEGYLSGLWLDLRDAERAFAYFSASRTRVNQRGETEITFPNANAAAAFKKLTVEIRARIAAAQGIESAASRPGVAVALGVALSVEPAPRFTAADIRAVAEREGLVPRREATGGAT